MDFLSLKPWWWRQLPYKTYEKDSSPDSDDEDEAEAGQPQPSDEAAL